MLRLSGQGQGLKRYPGARGGDMIDVLIYIFATIGFAVVAVFLWLLIVNAEEARKEKDPNHVDF